MKKFITLLLLICFSLTSACASIVSSGSENLTVTSSPSNAHVVIKNKEGNIVYDGTSPATIELDKSAGFFKPEEYTVDIEQEGYEKRSNIVKMAISGWYLLGNLGFGGFIGWLIVDPATGAMYKLDPNKLNIDFNAPVEEDNIENTNDEEKE